MHKDPPVVLVIFLQPMVELLNMRLVKKPQDTPLELPRALAGNDLHERYALLARIVHHSPQFFGNRLPVLEDIVEIEDEFGHAPSVDGATQERTTFDRPIICILSPGNANVPQIFEAKAVMSN